MENSESNKVTERINYIRDCSTGKEVLVASPVNFPSIIYDAVDMAEMESVGKAAISAYIKFTQDIISQESPFEFKEMTMAEFEAREDNIDYWEMYRILRILKRPTVRGRWLQVIQNALANPSEDKSTMEDIYDALSTQDIEQYSPPPAKN